MELSDSAAVVVALKAASAAAEVAARHTFVVARALSAERTVTLRVTITDFGPEHSPRYYLFGHDRAQRVFVSSEPGDDLARVIAESDWSEFAEQGPEAARDERPIGAVLEGIEIPPLPPGSVAREFFSLIKVENEDGGSSWAARYTADLDEDELLGVLVGYVDHLKRQAATGWAEG